MEIRAAYGVPPVEIRGDCLTPLPGPWAAPSGEEIAAAISMAGLNATSFAKLIAVEPRSVRRWLKGDAFIPYAAWSWLAARAGLAHLWEVMPPPASGAHSFQLEPIPGLAGWRLRLYEHGQAVGVSDHLPEGDQDAGAYLRAQAQGAAWLDSLARSSNRSDNL